MGFFMFRYGIIFYFSCIFILFHEWACREEFSHTLVKKTHNEMLFFPPEFEENETNFDIKCCILVKHWCSLAVLPETFVYLLFFMNSNQLYVLLNLMRYFVRRLHSAVLLFWFASFALHLHFALHLDGGTWDK